MKVTSYIDMDGNKVIMGDLVEEISRIEGDRLQKVIDMEHDGDYVWVRFEGKDNEPWTCGSKYTRKVDIKKPSNS